MTTNSESVPSSIGGSRDVAPQELLPAHMRVLFIHTHRELADHLTAALACDRASQVHVYEALGVSSGLNRLRRDAFDVVLISHDPPALNALDVLDAVKAGGASDLPVIVLGLADEADLGPWCYEAGADAYVTAPATSVRSFLWTVARVMQHARLSVENRRLTQLIQQRQERDREEAGQYLYQLESIGCSMNPPDAIPAPLQSRYRELMRAHVVMGSGLMGDEVGVLADLLALAEIPPRDFLRLHGTTLEELIADLGSRSARHIMHRAGLLALDVGARMAERFQQTHR